MKSSSSLNLLQLHQLQMSVLERSLVRVLDEYSLMMLPAMDQSHDLLTVPIVPLVSTTVSTLMMLVWFAQVGTICKLLYMLGKTATYVIYTYQVYHR